MTDVADGMVLLHRDPSDCGIALEQLPPWVRPSRRYWHQPRSARLRPEGDLTVVLWCGSWRRVTVADLAYDAPEEDRCGTCLGRRLGFDRQQGAIFSPRDHWTLPARCPGRTWADDHRSCTACGTKVRAAGGINGWGTAQHRPAPGLAERWRPCPSHGWSRMYEADARLLCLSFRCEWDGTP